MARSWYLNFSIDPQKWFSLDSQNNISQLDFYLTLGNTNYGFPSNIVPLPLNGTSFSLKVGLLLNEMEHTTQYNTGVSGGVASMSAPTGLKRRR